MPYSSIDPAPPSPPESPGLPATSSTSRLILLPDTDDRDPLQDYTTDDEDDSEDSDPQQAIYQQPILPLTRSVVFLYLLSPYLRLGAIYTLGIGNASLTYGVSGLVVAASLSAFCRQIWFLLGRYLRKSSTEDILIHIFARRHRRGPKHGSARYTVTIISGLFRLLIAAMYLRGWYALRDHGLSFLMLLVKRFRRLCAPTQDPRIHPVALSCQCCHCTIYSSVCTFSPKISGLQVSRVHNWIFRSFICGVVGRRFPVQCREKAFTAKSGLGSLVE